MEKKKRYVVVVTCRICAALFPIFHDQRRGQSDLSFCPFTVSTMMMSLLLFLIIEQLIKIVSYKPSQDKQRKHI